MIKKFVYEDYPVANLPEDLREGFDLSAYVCVTIEVDVAEPDENAPTDDRGHG